MVVVFTPLIALVHVVWHTLRGESSHGTRLSSLALYVLALVCMGESAARPAAVCRSCSE